MFKNQRGQALLIVVLVLVVALTVGLSVASRSITNLRTSQDQASSQKALAAAESGVEQAIKNQNQPLLEGSFNGENTNYKTTVTQISGATKFLIHGNNDQINEITKGTSAYIWTTDYTVANPVGWTGTLTISWGDSSGPACPNAAALEVSVISGTKASPTSQKYVYDPCTGRNNGFDTADVHAGGTINFPNLSYHVILTPTLINSALLISVNPHYADTRIGVLGSGAKPLPAQGANIDSTGTDNQVQRRAFVFQGLPQIPAEFSSYTIFSP